jgi:hypothetical protein
MNGAIPPLPLNVSMPCTGVTLNFAPFQYPEMKRNTFPLEKVVENGRLKIRI